jgi:hypothetical protein
MIPTQTDNGTKLKIKHRIKSLEQECENFTQTVSAETEPINSLVKSATIVGFMAGVNSKWVQVEKIKAQIELLYQARIAPITWFDQKFEELDRQLKQLQDEQA